MHTPDLTADNIEAYLAEQSAKDMLRFITCGVGGRWQVHPDRQAAV